MDTDSGEINGELVSLVAPLPRLEYESVRERLLTDQRATPKLAGTLPADLLQALSLDTAALRKQGWSQPPAARRVNYLRPLDALRPLRRVHAAAAARATTAQFLLVGKPLPRVEDTIRIGELFRAAVMGQAKLQLGAGCIPSVFSGHDLPGNNRHGHAFYLPWDADGDGRIDRLLLHVPVGMDGEQRRVIESLGRLWSRDGGSQWRLALESVGDARASALMAPARCWLSVTPYLHPWHRKRRFDIEDQIRRECRERGLPEPVELEVRPAISVGGRWRQSIHFRRMRNRAGLDQPDRLGSFWRLSFPVPVAGPLALGFGCHFGLGLFAPA